jgi:heavy metal efflux system protein
MTAMMAAIGLLPAAISSGIGSESQKPLAIVIIGGLVTATIFTLLVFPIIYHKALHLRERKKQIPKVN